MAGKLKHGRPGRRRSSRVLVFASAVVLSLSLAVVAGPATAKKISGTKAGDKLVGTKKADKINGKGGADKIKGKGGNDKLKGGKGNDRLAGGKGKDRITGGKGADIHLGGAGDDTLNTADGRLDKVIDGGAGNNTCIIDTALELSIAKGCGTIQAGQAPGGGGPGGGDPNSLTLLTADGVSGCAQQVLPLCLFTISGTGAEALLGTVTGGPGITALGVGVNVAIIGPSWTAIGLYACNADSFLRVTIGAKSVDVPVDCA